MASVLQGAGDAALSWLEGTWSDRLQLQASPHVACRWRGVHTVHVGTANHFDTDRERTLSDLSMSHGNHALGRHLAARVLCAAALVAGIGTRAALSALIADGAGAGAEAGSKPNSEDGGPRYLVWERERHHCAGLKHQRASFACMLAEAKVLNRTAGMQAANCSGPCVRASA